MSAAEDVLAFLHAVRRKMQAQQLADALRGAAKVSLGLVLGLVALHFGVRALSGLWLMLALALPVLGAACFTLLRRPDIGRAALYADRTLGGHSGFATCFEFLIERRGAPSTAALAALANWSRSALGPARQQLRRQHIQGVRETIVATASASLVALAAAMLPGRDAQQPASIASSATDATVPAAGAPPAVRQDPAAALQRALRNARASGEESAVGSRQRATIAATQRVDAARASQAERARGSTSAATAGSDGEGRNAGAGTATTHVPTRASAPAPAPRSMMREIRARQPAAAGAADPSSAPLPASDAALAEALDFDRRRIALAREAPAARVDARTGNHASGPAVAALLRRWSQLESSQ